MNTLLQDLRYGLRMLAKNPGFTAVTVLTFAMAIGANTAVFSVADAIFFNPLPSVPESNRLTVLVDKWPQFWSRSVAPANFVDWKSQGQSFSGMAAYKWKSVDASGDAAPQRLDGVQASSEFFNMLDAKPILGRSFTAEEEQPGHPAVVLSYGLWQRRFGGDVGVLGRTLKLDGQPVPIVGVMAKEFAFPSAADIWLPLALTSGQWSDRAEESLAVVAKLKSGVSLAHAQAEMAAIASRLEVAYPQTDKQLAVLVAPLRDYLNGNLTPVFTLTLMGAVGLLLLLAAANVANLQLTRMTVRYREVATRAALGAARGRLVGQFLTESLLLAAVGAGVGVFFALLGMRWIAHTMPPDTARQIAGWDQIHLDTRVLLFAVAVTVFAGVASGLVPSFQGSKVDLNEALKSSGAMSAAHRSQRLRSVLVTAQIALALVLAIAAGLMVKGFHSMLSAAQAFEPSGLLTMRVGLPKARYDTEQSRVAFLEQALERLGRLPGASAAGTLTTAPFSNNGTSWENFVVAGRPAVERQPAAVVQAVSPGYFALLHISLLRGRDFVHSDGASSLPVAIVNRKLAEKYWPGHDPLGRQLKLGKPDSRDPWLTVVGIADDVEYDWTDNEAELAIYRPFAQAAPANAILGLRAHLDPSSLIPAARHELADLDPDLPVTDAKPLERVMVESMAGILEIGGIMSTLGLIALVLAAVGVYGVMAFSVTQRTQELGIRMALGAAHSDVLKLIVLRGALVTLVGVLGGLAGALAMGNLISGFFYGVSPTDPATLVVVSVMLTATAMLACYVPARRALKIDPMVALRYE